MRKTEITIFSATLRSHGIVFDEIDELLACISFSTIVVFSVLFEVAYKESTQIWNECRCFVVTDIEIQGFRKIA